MFRKNPQWIGFIMASIVGLSSLVVYQNCGLPDPKTSSPSTPASNDFYRWMPDTVVSFSCDNNSSPDAFPRFWTFGVTNLQAPSSSKPIPSGIYLSDYGKTATKGLSASVLAGVLPRQDIALVALNYSTFDGHSSNDWQPIFSFSNSMYYSKSITRSNKPLNVKSSGTARIPASDFAAGVPTPFGANNSPSPLYGGSAVYSNTWMKVFFDPTLGAYKAGSGNSYNTSKQFALGLLFTDPNSFDSNAPQFITSLDSKSNQIKSGSGLITSSYYYGHILQQVLQVNNAGSFDLAGSNGYTWKCPWPSDGGVPSPSNPNSMDKMFMVFAWPDYRTDTNTTPSGIYCDASMAQNSTNFPKVPVEMFNEYYFGRMAGALNSETAFNCVFKKLVNPALPSASENCYPTTLAHPIYTTANFTANPQAAWMSICTRE